jgi:hypothetical protein
MIEKEYLDGALISAYGPAAEMETDIEVMNSAAHFAIEGWSWQFPRILPERLARPYIHEDSPYIPIPVGADHRFVLLCAPDGIFDGLTIAVEITGETLVFATCYGVVAASISEAMQSLKAA